MVPLIRQKVWFFLLSLFFLAYCGGDLGIIAGPYSVGGTLTGLSGTVVLQNNSGDDLTLTDDGSFTFETPVEDGETYAVTVLTQPDTKTCSVSRGSGTIEGDNVTNVSIVCATDTYAVGGTLSGLSGTVVLQNNAGDDLTLTSDGTFTFATAVADGAGYEVTVLTQPDAQTCSVSSGSGTIEGVEVTDVSVVCATDTYTVGGTLSGVSGTVVLQNNSGDNLSLTSNSTFTFTTAVADGAGYVVTVLTQPSGQTCTVSSGSGTLDGANVTNVSVVCAIDTYTVGGTLTGLSGGTVVLQNNAGNNLSLISDSTFTFTTAVANGSAYAVTVLTQPVPPLTCTVASGSGTISGANVTNVSVVCAFSASSYAGTYTASDTSGGDPYDCGNPTTATFTANGSVISGTITAGTDADRRAQAVTFTPTSSTTCASASIESDNPCSCSISGTVITLSSCSKGAGIFTGCTGLTLTKQ